MSRHSNQATASAPSSEGAPAGNNPTYKTHVQRDAGKKSSTKAAGSNKRVKDLSVDGAHRTTEPTKGNSVPGTNANVGGFGDGHYVPNK